MNEYYKNNYVKLTGKIDSEIKYNHTSYKEEFFIFTVKTTRLSDIFDYVPVIISDRLVDISTLRINSLVQIEGQYRSYNNTTNEPGNKLILVVFAKEIKVLNEDVPVKNPNYIRLNGFLCKKPVYRQTPLGREISDILLAVNRQYGKSDYIPCIAWGRNARYISHLDVGTNIIIWGRIQSRNYQKKINDEVVTKTAYEVSASRIEIVDEEQDEEQNVENR